MSQCYATTDVYSNELDSEEIEINDNSCYRCGREGHYYPHQW